MRVTVNHLVRHFGKTQAVNDISFSFGEGQIFGFIGPNGAGKTTTMRVLATLDEPTSGDCYIDGVSVVQYPERTRQLIGYMPDTLPTHRDMTVHDYLDFFARAYGVRAEKRKRVVERIEEFTNLLGIRHKTLKALSKGMKQRVSLARAMVHDPILLIMDEPAAGLDPRARIELRELLKALSEQGKAILISSHILTELAEIVTGAVFIERGKLLRAGTLKDLTQQESLHQQVLIRPLDRLAEVQRHVLQSPDIEKATISGLWVEAVVRGDDASCGRMLASLIQSGYTIVEFRQKQADLEQVFMSVTKGEVQ